jgi:hypothetical protein
LFSILVRSCRFGSRIFRGGLPIPGVTFFVLSSRCCQQHGSQGVTMEWTTPQHEEIDLNCEVSSYANAEL